MLKKAILDLINTFETETWKYVDYVDNDKLHSDMQYIYSIKKEIQGVDEANLKSVYDKLLSMMGIIRFKYGFESMIINSNPELENLKKIINDISLSSVDIINKSFFTGRS